MFVPITHDKALTSLSNFRVSQEHLCSHTQSMDEDEDKILDLYNIVC